ncbi:pilus assembly protein [Pararhizobium sp. BT-229]|uniref:TadE/TadG family type IV pilus assembly protein n=1 Tax=Pararhizobium sp. BT-229 TaxID=2986923 RepID=UPI0021F74E75|nr:TadE family protein [Pararhizobium sp. BT-229]MCV9963610.1 pilus assembly protein [Pararhizobium sp. BT-229]
MRSLKFKNFRSADDGATAVEFALVSPVLFFLTFGIVETGIVYAADILLKNATYDAARTGRTGFVSEGATQDDTVKRKILSQAGVLMDPDKIVFTSKSYEGFDNLRKPEPFTDKNGNGRRDDGENYTDVNGNGKYDTDQGAAGYGGTKQVVLYTVTYPWTFRTPLLREVIGNNGTVELTATAVVQNEPY